MYDQIANNKRKSFLLIFVFSALLIALGWFFGMRFGDARAGILIAVFVATASALLSYFAGDQAALLVNGAKRLEKNDAPELWRLVENLAITAGLPMPKLYLIEDHAPNAFATGRNPQHASVAVTSGLLALLDHKELEGVIAHELSHIGNDDILVMTIVIILVGSVMMLSEMMLRTSFRRGDRDRDSNQSTLVLFIIGLVLAVLSPLMAQLIKLAVSRSREYLADASGALLTRYPEGLASALTKISANAKPMQRANGATAHLFIANPFAGSKQFLSGLFSTHPPIEERIKKLRAML